MIRTRKIIGKDKIFTDYIGNKEISKLEILTSKQTTIKNPEVVSVYIYHRIPWTDCLTIIGLCQVFCTQYPKHQYHNFVNGMISAKRDGFISECNINKLIKIGDELKFNFGISKKIKELCKPNFK